MQQSASWAANSAARAWPAPLSKDHLPCLPPHKTAPASNSNTPSQLWRIPAAPGRAAARRASATPQKLADFRETHVLVVVADDHLLLVAGQLLDGLLQHPVVAVRLVLLQRVVARWLLLGDAQFEEVAERQVDGGIGQLLQIEVAAVQAVAFGNAFGLADRALAVADVAGSPLSTLPWI